MTTATESKPEVEAKTAERSPSPVKSESFQKSPTDSIPQSTDAVQSDRVSETDAKRFPRIREHDDRKIFVGNLPVQTNTDELIEHFSQAGPVEYATVIKSRDGALRRYGFIVFTNKEDSIKAVDTLNNVPFGDSALVVQSIVPRPRRPRMRRSRMYSGRREGFRRGSSYDQGGRQHVESGTEEDEEQRQSSRPYGSRSYRGYRNSGRRTRYPHYSYQNRQEVDDGTPNTQGTQTQDSQSEGPVERERSQSYGRRRRSPRGARRSYPRRPRGEDSGYVAGYSSSSQGEEYNGERDEPRGHRGQYSGSQEYGYRSSGRRNYRTSQERGSFRRRSGPHPSEYRPRGPRTYYNNNQHYDDRHAAPTEDQYSKVGVFVGNLPYRVVKETLADFFSEKGYSVSDAYVVRDINKKSKGYGFVEFETHEDQVKAIRDIDGQELYDRIIAIKPAVVSRRTSESFGHHQREE